MPNFSVTLLSLLAYLLIAGYGLLLFLVRGGKDWPGRPRAWLFVALGLALLAQVSLLPLAGPGVAGGSALSEALRSALAGAALAAFIALLFSALVVPGARLIFIAGALFWAVYAVMRLAPPGLPQDVDRALRLGGWLAPGALGLVAVFWRLLRVRAVQAGNRALHWLVALLLVWLWGMLAENPALLPLAGLSPADEAALTTLFRDLSGQLAPFAGLGLAVYLVRAPHVIDVRRAGPATGLILALWLVQFAGLGLTALGVAGWSGSLAGLIPPLMALAGVLALIMAPLLRMAFRAISRWRRRPTDVLRAEVDDYALRVGSLVELDRLAEEATALVARAAGALRVRFMVAAPDGDEAVRFKVLTSGQQRADVSARMPRTGLLYRTLAVERRPLLRSELQTAFTQPGLSLEARAFLMGLDLSGYIPVLDGDTLVGCLGVGLEPAHEPLHPAELALLSEIAARTAPPLRNALMVTDLRRSRDEAQAANQEMGKTKERLEQLDSVKSDFVTIASHELRTPLAQIRGYTDILDAYNDQGMLDAEQVATMTANLRKATDRLDRLIADMLDVSQLGLDAMDLRFATTTLDSIFKQAVEPLIESINQRRLQLTARGLKALPRIEADSQRLVQAFRNVIVNAVRYTPDGGQIEVSGSLVKNPTSGDQEVQVTFTDTGVGLDPIHLELVFEKFYRVGDPSLHSTGSTKFMGAGPGLGLTIARGVIQGHGGRIWLESTGRDLTRCPGTTVTVVLPIVPPASAKRVLPFEDTRARRPTRQHLPVIPPVQ
ncbi:MAG: hypothetical protein IT323_10535 [Anaerolineae bacterium]|nr:hypothetical protein [Anaerolineae bacterium]